MNIKIILSIAITMIISGSCTQKSSSYFSFPPEAEPAHIGKQLAENLLSRDYMLRADKSAIHYAEIITADAAIEFTRQIKDTMLFQQLEERYGCILEKDSCFLISSATHSQVNGAMIMLAMYNWTHEQQYLDCTYDLMQSRWIRWANPDPKNDPIRKARYWSDDMYFGCTLETRIFKITQDPGATDRVSKWLTAYVDSLQLPNGLIRHTTEVPFIWGRGVGWAAAGLANSLEGMPLDHPKRQYLMDSYLKLMEGLIPYQSPGGLWRQLIDDPQSWEETSGTGMIAYSMLTGIRMGWLEEEKYAPIVEKAWLALVENLDEHGALAEVCVGTNEKQTAQGYLDRPRRAGDHHGQAPLLWTANALLLLEN